MARKKYLFVFFLFWGFLPAACKPAIEQIPSSTMIEVQPTSQEADYLSSDVYLIEGYQLNSPVNNGNAIAFWGSLFRNGTILSGMSMHATWPDPTAERGIAQCDVLVSYGRGNCTIFTDQLPPANMFRLRSDLSITEYIITASPDLYHKKPHKLFEGTIKMNRRNYWLLTLIIIISLLLASCKDQTDDNQAQLQSYNQVSTLETVEKNGDIFIVEGWVIKSGFDEGKSVVVVASLLKNGFRLGDENVHITWPDPSKDRELGGCDVFSHHGTAECVVITEHLNPGEYVPVTIRFEFEGNYYYGKTGFIPE